MKEINIFRLWQITNIIQEELHKIDEEKDVFIKFSTINDYDSFLEIYSFKIETELKKICYYNNDYIPNEDYTYNEYNYLPFEILEMNDDEVKKYAYGLYEDILSKEKNDKKLLIKRLKNELEILQKQLKNLENEEKTK